MFDALEAEVRRAVVADVAKDVRAASAIVDRLSGDLADAARTLVNARDRLAEFVGVYDEQLPVDGTQGQRALAFERATAATGIDALDDWFRGMMRLWWEL